jgi:hypothetical protein
MVVVVVVIVVSGLGTGLPVRIVVNVAVMSATLFIVHRVLVESVVVDAVVLLVVVIVVVEAVGVELVEVVVGILADFAAVVGLAGHSLEVDAGIGVVVVVAIVVADTFVIVVVVVVVEGTVDTDTSKLYFQCKNSSLSSVMVACGSFANFRRPYSPPKL